MKRFVSLAATFALSLPVAAFAEEPKPKSARLDVLIERPKAEPAASAKSVAAPQTPAERPGATHAILLDNPWGGSRAAAAWHIDRTEKEVKLSAEQKARILLLFEQRDQAMRAAQASISAKAQILAREMTEASQSKNQEAIAKSQKAFHDLYAPLNEIMKKMNSSLEEVLTPEQKAKLQAAQRTAMNPAGVAVAHVASSGTPGGTFQIQISEATQAAEQARANAELQQKHAEIQRKNAELQQQAAEAHRQNHQQQEAVQRQLEAIVKKQHASHRDGLRERVRRQRDLTKQATKILKKLDELDSDESPKARELWAQLERTQAELQQTFGGPQVHTFSIAPGQPAGAVVTGIGGNFGGAGFGGVISGGGIVSSGGANSGGIVVSSQQGPAQANPAAVHVRPLKLASPQNAAAQPSNADLLKSLEAIRVRIEAIEGRIGKTSK